MYYMTIIQLKFATQISGGAPNCYGHFEGLFVCFVCFYTKMIINITKSKKGKCVASKNIFKSNFRQKYSFILDSKHYATSKQ